MGKKVEVLDMEELGMEAVWKIEVQDFPAFVIVDNKGNDFFKKWVPDGTDPAPEEDSTFDEAADMFFGIDADGSGAIDIQELAKGLSISEESAQTLLSKYDTDKSGELDLKEFELLLFQNHDFVLAAQEKLRAQSK